ncbi:unnamed protein product, partial [Acanthoscelides obtectus]
LLAKHAIDLTEREWYCQKENKSWSSAVRRALESSAVEDLRDFFAKIQTVKTKVPANNAIDLTERESNRTLSGQALSPYLVQRKGRMLPRCRSKQIAPAA